MSLGQRAGACEQEMLHGIGGHVHGKRLPGARPAKPPPPNTLFVPAWSAFPWSQGATVGAGAAVKRRLRDSLRQERARRRLRGGHPPERLGGGFRRRSHRAKTPGKASAAAVRSHWSHCMAHARRSGVRTMHASGHPNLNRSTVTVRSSDGVSLRRAPPSPRQRGLNRPRCALEPWQGHRRWSLRAQG